MNSRISSKIIKTSIVVALAFLGFACQKQSAVQTNGAQTPTEAYKMLFAAVKAKDTGKIKQMMSKDTQNMAQFQAERQKDPIEKIYENGYTATTLADTLPEIRDERVKDNFGAIEVRNQKEKKWEDLPFIYEEGGWKLAIGDIFKGTYKSPGKGQAQIEQDATNTMGNIPIQMMPNSNGNFPKTANSNKSVEVPPVKEHKK
jgi:hypothetical protein